MIYYIYIYVLIIYIHFPRNFKFGMQVAVANEGLFNNPGTDCYWQEHPKVYYIPEILHFGP